MAEGTINITPADWAKRKKAINLYTYPVTINEQVDPKGADKEMGEILKALACDFQDAVTAGVKGSGGTIVLDGGTMLHAYLSQRASKKQDEMRAKRIWGSAYGERNAFWKALMDTSEGCNRHLIVIHHEGEEWGADGPTGKVAASGDKLVHTEVDMIIQMVRSEGQVMRDAKGKPILGAKGKAKMEVEFGLVVKDCRGNSGLREMELPWLSFDELYELVQG